MSQLRRIKKRAVGYAAGLMEAGLEVIGVPRPKILLVLGHMRSGSSLLLHLLMTNDEVSALGERNAVYASRADFARLAVATRISHRSPFRHSRYVADQVNHNRFTPNSDLLRDPRVQLVFLLRQPDASVASLLELSRAHYQQAWSASRAVDYYVQRLAFLTQLGESLPSTVRAAFVHYESITDRPEATLEALRLCFELRQGFSQTYRTYPFSQTRGDPGPNIILGRIVRKEAAAPGLVHAAELEPATNAYRECCRALERFALL